MEILTTYLNSPNPRLDDLHTCLQEVGESGDSMTLKKDGLRTERHYTLIVFTADHSFGPIRADGASLADAARVVFPEYLQMLGASVPELKAHGNEVGRDGTQPLSVLADFLEEESTSFARLMDCFEAVGDAGDVISMTVLGNEKPPHYRVAILDGQAVFDPVVVEAERLEEAARSAFGRYLEERGLV